MYFRKLHHAIRERKSWIENVGPEQSLIRAIHLLVERYNAAMNSLLCSLLLSSGMTQVISASTLIRQPNFNSADIILNLFYLAITINTFFITTVMYGFAGDFFAASDFKLSHLKRNVVKKTLEIVLKREHRFRSRFLAACQVEKVQFCVSNFIEKTTPLVFELYILDRTVDMLLVTNKSVLQ